MSAQTSDRPDGQAPQAMQSKLDLLRQRFVDRSISDLATLRAMLKLRGVSGERAEAELALTRLAHSLTGAAGIFGFPEISDAAAALEAALKQEPIDEPSMLAEAESLAERLSDLPGS